MALSTLHIPSFKNFGLTSTPAFVLFHPTIPLTIKKHTCQIEDNDKSIMMLWAYGQVEGMLVIRIFLV
jgi:hypothetical protein